MGDLQHVVAVLKPRVVRNQSEAVLHTMPILVIGFGVMERIGFFEKVAGGGKPVFADDVVVVLRTMGTTGSGPCDGPVLFEYILNHTNCAPWDWDLKEIPQE